jgi:hypothetical protein
MLDFKKIKSATLNYLIIIVEKIYFALNMIFIALGLIFFFGFTTKLFIVNPHIFKANKIARHKIVVIKKYLNNK